MFLFTQHPLIAHFSFTQKIPPYHSAICVKSDLSCSFLHSSTVHKTDKNFRFSRSFFFFFFFAGELKLTVSNVAIQLWSRAVLQGCHDRINENNIGESHFIHLLLGKRGWGPHFKRKCQLSRASQQQVKKQEISKVVQRREFMLRSGNNLKFYIYLHKMSFEAGLHRQGQRFCLTLNYVPTSFKTRFEIRVFTLNQDQIRFCRTKTLNSS